MLSTVSQFIGTEFDYAQYKTSKTFSVTYNDIKTMLNGDENQNQEESKDKRTDKSLVQSKS